MFKNRLSVQWLAETSMSKNITVLPKMHCGGGNFTINLPMVQFITICNAVNHNLNMHCKEK